MKRFFTEVRKHIDKLDATTLREQYGVLADEADFFENICRSVHEGIAILDNENKVVYQNPEVIRLVGKDFNFADFEGKTELEVSYPEHRYLEVQVIHTERHHSTIVVIRDVTAEHARSEEEQSAASLAAISEIAGSFAHEIGNPLNAMSLNLQLMKRDYPSDESIDVCMHQIERLDSIIKSYLGALRPQKPCLIPGSVAEPLSNALKAFKNQFDERKIAAVLDIPGALPVVAIDKSLFEQALFNLLKNALEAMTTGGSLQVAVSSDDDSVIVTIEDNGAGMSDEQLKHLFEPYLTTKKHGNGLGMMVTLRIIRAHGGSIGVKSTPQVGTKFTIRIPRIEKRVRVLK